MRTYQFIIIKQRFSIQHFIILKRSLVLFSFSLVRVFTSIKYIVPHFRHFTERNIIFIVQLERYSFAINLFIKL